MTSDSQLYNEAMKMLEKTSRTFFIPISLLPPKLKEAVASSYLCMRAIDEIEDHAHLNKDVKVRLLKKIKELSQIPFRYRELEELLRPYKQDLPEVTLRLGDWIRFCPASALERVLAATRKMASGMANWVEKEFKVCTEKDLDEYTYYVAGLVGELLSDLWYWYDKIETDKILAVAFGRGLQAVNMIRNRKEDLARGGVDFFPENWNMDDMFAYAKRNLKKAEEYVKTINKGPILHFCQIPLALAKGTLEAIEKGKEKLSREEVIAIVNKVCG